MTEHGPILTIVVALNCEAKPWIDYYRLKKVCSRPFSSYESEDVNIVISGVGPLAMATAVGWIGARSSRPRAWLNIGTAGHFSRALGEIFLVHGSAQSEQGHAHYPPQVVRWKGATDALLSVSQPCANYPDGAAVDMEASAFYSAATRFASSELVQSIKVVSDNPENGYESLTAAKISALMQPHQAMVVEFAESLCELVIMPLANTQFEQLMTIRSTVSQQRLLAGLLHRVVVLGLERDAQQLNCKQPVKLVLKALESILEQAVPQLK